MGTTYGDVDGSANGADNGDVDGGFPIVFYKLEMLTNLHEVPRRAALLAGRDGFAQVKRGIDGTSIFVFSTATFRRDSGVTVFRQLLLTIALACAQLVYGDVFLPPVGNGRRNCCSDRVFVCVCCCAVLCQVRLCCVALRCVALRCKMNPILTHACDSKNMPLVGRKP